MNKRIDESSQPGGGTGEPGSQAVTAVRVQEHCSFVSSGSPLGPSGFFPSGAQSCFQLLGVVAGAGFLCHVEMPYRKCIWVLNTCVSGLVLSPLFHIPLQSLL